MAAVEIGLLGSFHVLQRGEPVRLRSKKQRMLLARLALADGEVVSRDAIVEGLWPAGPPDSVDSTLNSYVSGLRRALEPDLTRASESMLATQGLGYRLDNERVTVDVRRFDAYVDDGAWSEALALVRGEPLADFVYDDFFAADVERLNEAVVIATEHRIGTDLQAGRHRDVLPELTTLVAEHPVREHLRAMLMLALYRSGRQADALAAFQHGRGILLDELGLEPGPELVELEARILAQDPSLEVAVAASPIGATEAMRPASGLYGRGRALAQLHRALDAAVDVGRVVLVGADAGMGKTTLLRAVVEESRARGRIIETATAASGHGYYEVWARAIFGALGDDAPAVLSTLPARLREPLLRVMPHIAPVIEAAPPEPIEDLATAVAMTEALVEGAQVLLSAGPVTCALDDLHVADAASLALFTRLSLAVTELPGLLLIGSFRESAVAENPALADMLARISGRPGVSRITLSGLEVEETREWLGDIGLEIDDFRVGQLVAHTGGNPLYISELARAAVDGEVDLSHETPVTEAVADAIRSRLESLAPGVREVLDLAACAETSVSAEVDALVLDRPVHDVEDAHDVAISAGLLEVAPDSPGNVRFVHRVVADVVYDEIAPRRRARLHGAIAAAIEADAGDQAHRYAPLLARHYSLSARSQTAALRWFRIAAAQANAVLDHREALHHARRALEIIETSGAPPEVESEVRVEVARQARLSGDLELATEHFLRAYADATAVGDTHRRARVAALFSSNVGTTDARAWWDPGTLGYEAIDEALDALGADGSPELRAELLARRAADGRDLSAAQRVRLADEARGILEEHQLDELRLDLAGPLLLAGWDAAPAGVMRDRADEIVASAQAADRIDIELEVRRWAVGFAAATGDLDDAADRAEGMLRRSALRGLPPAFANGFAARPLIATLKADFGVATALLTAAEPTIRPSSGADEVRELALLSLGWHTDELKTADAFPSRFHAGHRVTMAALGALVLAGLGEQGLGSEMMRSISRAELSASRGPIDWGTGGCAMARFGEATGDRDAMELALLHLDPLAGWINLPGPGCGTIGAIDTYRARALIGLGRLDEAQAAVASSRAMAEAAGPGLVALETMEVEARLAAAQGRIDDAETLWVALRDSAAAAGATRLAGEASRHLT